jgi:hypothetical protein
MLFKTDLADATNKLQNITVSKCAAVLSILVHHCQHSVL